MPKINEKCSHTVTVSMDTRSDGTLRRLAVNDGDGPLGVSVSIRDGGAAAFVRVWINGYEYEFIVTGEEG